MRVLLAVLSSALFLLLAALAPASAQEPPPAYWHLTLGPYGRDVFALAQTDDSRQFAGTSDGVFARSGTGGTWRRSAFARLNVPKVVAERDDLYAGVLGASPGGSAQAYRSTDGGATWIPFPAELPGTQVYALGAVPGGRVFASTENGLYSAELTDTAWTLESVPTNTVVVGLPLGPDGTTLYACGSPARVFRRTGTGAWEDLSAGIGLTLMTGCHVSAGGAVYASSYSLMRRLPPTGPWESVRAGLGTSPFTGPLAAFAEAPDGTLFVAGYRPFQLAPGATAWEVLPEVRPIGELQTESVTEALLVGSDGVLVAGTMVSRLARPVPVPPPGPYGRYPHYYGGAYEYAADAWRSTGGGLTLEAVTAVVLGPGGVAWAATDGAGVHRIDPSLDIEPGRLEAWARDDGPLALANVPFLSSAAGDALVAGTDSVGPGRVWRRTGPDAWDDVTGGLPTGPLTAVLVTDTGVLLAAVEGVGIYRLPLGASIWQATSPWPASRDAGVLSAVGALVAVGDRAGGVALSADDGTSWTVATSLPAPATTFAAGRAGEILAGTRGAGVRVSVDGGASWGPLGRVLEADTVTALVVAPGSTYAGVPGRGVLRLASGASSWEPANTWLTDFDVVGLAATPQGYLYAATPRTVVQGAGYVPVAGEPGPDPQRPQVTLSVYPNPTSGRTVVMLGLSAPTLVHVVLLDALGRTVAVLHDGIVYGGTPLLVETSGLPAGVYTVRVTGPAASVSRPLTIVR